MQWVVIYVRHCMEAFSSQVFFKDSIGNSIKNDDSVKIFDEENICLQPTCSGNLSMNRMTNELNIFLQKHISGEYMKNKKNKMITTIVFQVGLTPFSGVAFKNIVASKCQILGKTYA